jgi:hypothetical protein
MTSSVHPELEHRAGAFRAEIGAGDTIPEPELAIAAAAALSACATRVSVRPFPRAQPEPGDKVTARYDEEELVVLREALEAARTRARTRAPKSVPASIVARRSFGPPLPRTDDE